MARKLQSDKWLFLATLALVSLSVVMVYSASALVALERFQQPYLFVTKQVMWALLGIAVLSIVMRVDYRVYRNDTLMWTLLAGVGLLLVAVLFARPVNGARRWFGIAGFGIQPSELAKLVADHVHRDHARAAHAPRQRSALRAAAHRHHRRACSSA